MDAIQLNALSRKRNLNFLEEFVRDKFIMESGEPFKGHLAFEEILSCQWFMVRSLTFRKGDLISICSSLGLYSGSIFTVKSALTPLSLNLAILKNLSKTKLELD